MKLCNMCGNKFDIWDEQANFGIHRIPSYGSKFDGERIELDLCCDCFDKIMDIVIPMCKENPIREV